MAYSIGSLINTLMHIYSEVSATEFNEAYFWENVTLDVSKGGFWEKKI